MKKCDNKILNLCIVIYCSDMAELSVIIPVHNAEMYLDRCITVLRNQHLDDIEMIFVVNASVDRSLQMCEAYAMEDKRVKVLNLEKGHPSIARNAGIAAASSEWVGFMDVDDTAEPEMYADMMSLAEENKLDIVVCSFLKRYAYRKDRYPFKCDGSVKICSGEELMKMSFLEQITQSVWVLVCRKSLFDDVRFPEDRLFEDTATTWKLMRNASKGGYMAKAYYHYWRNPGSIVHTLDFHKCWSHAMADRERIEYINSRADYTEEERQRLGKRIMEFFYRYMVKMAKYARTDVERMHLEQLRRWASELPLNYPLRKRYARVAFLMKSHRRLWMILSRLSLLR